MHYSSFPDYINVEKTSEQYFQLLLPHRKPEKSAQQDIYLSTRLDDRQVDDENESDGTI